MPSEDTKILDLSKYQKSHKASFIIYESLKWLIGEINECKKKFWKFIYNKSTLIYSIRFINVYNILI